MWRTTKFCFGFFLIGLSGTAVVAESDQADLHGHVFITGEHGESLPMGDAKIVLVRQEKRGGFLENAIRVGIEAFAEEDKTSCQEKRSALQKELDDIHQKYKSLGLSKDNTPEDCSVYTSRIYSAVNFITPYEELLVRLKKTENTFSLESSLLLEQFGSVINDILKVKAVIRDVSYSNVKGWWEDTFDSVYGEDGLCFYVENTSKYILTKISFIFRYGDIVLDGEEYYPIRWFLHDDKASLEQVEFYHSNDHKEGYQGLKPSMSTKVCYLLKNWTNTLSGEDSRWWEQNKENFRKVVTLRPGSYNETKYFVPDEIIVGRAEFIAAESYKKKAWGSRDVVGCPASGVTLWKCEPKFVGQSLSYSDLDQSLKKKIRKNLIEDNVQLIKLESEIKSLVTAYSNLADIPVLPTDVLLRVNEDLTIISPIHDSLVQFLTEKISKLESSLNVSLLRDDKKACTKKNKLLSSLKSSYDGLQREILEIGYCTVDPTLYQAEVMRELADVLIEVSADQLILFADAEGITTHSSLSDIRGYYEFEELEDGNYFMFVDPFRKSHQKIWMDDFELSGSSNTGLNVEKSFGPRKLRNREEILSHMKSMYVE